MWAVQLAFSPSANEFSGLTGLFCFVVITAPSKRRAAGRACVQQVQERTAMGFKILIVDDHEVVRQGIRTILRSRPQWEISGEAVNGKDAIEKAKALDPDVIIMDITMPEMS